MIEQYCITITREYGSGGRLIGKSLAEALGIKFYDKEIISLAAKEIGLSEEFIENAGDTRSRFFLYDLYGYNAELPLPERIYLAESQAIQSLAAEESSVFIGRSAAHVLKERENVFSVFIHAPMAYRLKVAQEIYHDKASNLKDFIQRQDKNRAVYNKLFSDQRWGEAKNYAISLDGSIGIQASVNVLKAYIEERLK
jgi:cytidylate kinase